LIQKWVLNARQFLAVIVSHNKTPQQIDTMTTFLNFDLDKPVQWKFFLRHLLYGAIWTLGIWVIIFRGDYTLFKNLPRDFEWVIKVVPFAFIALTLILMLKTKWYYNLVLVFYPLLILFWFLPKLVLNKGKVYLLSGYLNFLFLRIKKFKSTTLHFLLLSSVLLLLILTDSDIVRIGSMIYLSFFYYKIVVKYIKQSVQPAQLFGANVEKSLDNLIKEPEKSYSYIKNFEENKSDEKLPDEERKLKRVERLIIVNSIFEYLGTNLNSFKGKRAFVIAWIYQLIGFVILTFCYYTFMNFELFIIDKTNYSVTIEPTLFDFFYYTLKSITFSNIESIIPVSILARIIEILSFLTVGIFVLIIVTSVIFSIRQDRINDNIKKATEVCLSQTEFIAKHIKLQYSMDIASVFKEAKSIRESIENIKKVIERIL